MIILQKNDTTSTVFIYLFIYLQTCFFPWYSNHTLSPNVGTEAGQEILKKVHPWEKEIFSQLLISKSPAAMSSDSEIWEDTMPCCSTENDHQASTTTHLQQPPETYLSQDDSHSEPHHERNSNDGRIGPISSMKDAGSSKSAGIDPRHLPETKPLNISRKPRDDGPSITTPFRNPRKTQDSSGKPESRIEYNPLIITMTSSDPTQDRSPSNRSRNRPRSQKPRETGLSNSVSRPRKGSKDVPSIPSSSSGGPRLQYPQESHSQDLDEPPSIPSVQTEERNQYTYAQTHPQTQQPRVTRVSFSGNKPWDLQPPSLPIQIKGQFNYSQPLSQPQDTQTFSNDNIHAEHFKTSIPLQDQGLDRSADAGRPDTRPNLIHGTPSQLDTQYVNMLLALDDIPQLHKILAGFFNWILLAGFILFPGTFTSLQNLGGSSGQVAQLLVHQVTHIPL